MQLDELIEVVEKRKECLHCPCISKGFWCILCKNYIGFEKTDEMYNDILMRLKQEKWARDKMEEMRVEEVD